MYLKTNYRWNNGQAGAGGRRARGREPSGSKQIAPNCSAIEGGKCFGPFIILKLGKIFDETRPTRFPAARVTRLFSAPRFPVRYVRRVETSDVWHVTSVIESY